MLVNYQIRSLYSPDVATAVFGWLPLGAVYVYYIQEHGLANGWEWLAAIGYAVLTMTIIFYVIEQRFLGDNPPYPFKQDEFERFHIAQKLEAGRRARANHRQVEVAIDTRSRGTEREPGIGAKLTFSGGATLRWTQVMNHYHAAVESNAESFRRSAVRRLAHWKNR
jgi:hypothetical protein